MSYSNYKPSTAIPATPAKPTTTTGIRTASTAQISWYKDLCAQKKLNEVEGIADKSYQELSDLIQYAKNFYPATDPQKKLILTICESVEIEPPSTEELSRLTGGREGSASNLIVALQKKQDEMKIARIVTDEQIEMMLKMFLCPGIDFDSIGVPTKIMLGGEVTDENTGEVHETFSLPPVEKTVMAIKANLNQLTAREFIAKYKPTYYEWKKERLQIGQANRIKQLEERMRTISGAPKHVEQVIDIDGFTFNIVQKGSAKHKDATNSYTPLSDDQISMFTRDTAKKYIEELESELADKTLTRPFIEKYDDDVVNLLRSIKGQSDSSTEETESFEKFLFGMLSIAGYRDDELENAVTTYSEVDEIQSLDATQRSKIRFFMQSIVEDGSVNMFALLRMAHKSTLAWEILMEGVEAEETRTQTA